MPCKRLHRTMWPYLSAGQLNIRLLESTMRKFVKRPHCSSLSRSGSTDRPVGQTAREYFDARRSLKPPPLTTMKLTTFIATILLAALSVNAAPAPDASNQDLAARACTCKPIGNGEYLCIGSSCP
ncbi:unnamed protein product [Cyclocybe aegerita]|uniref:Uncharacterized protein n=1 Tax=Cyclocybe aegerita TaxID=1973307 RepID=A0A8S0WUR9_CYCAE|nr:unnamed protein product [Cyclocybe aegerita]